MNYSINKSFSLVVLLFLTASSFAQKIKSGYDKSVDFSKYASYTWAEASSPPARPLLYASVVGWTENLLKSKGLTSVESDGDLILVPAGGMEFGLNTAAGTPMVPSYSGQPPAIDATMWTGAGGASNLMAPYVPEGALMFTFIDRKTNKIVWTGTVTQKLDIENKKKSMELAEKAVTKLLMKFPPEKK
jgi:hypothetical protein